MGAAQLFTGPLYFIIMSKTARPERNRGGGSLTRATASHCTKTPKVTPPTVYVVTHSTIEVYRLLAKMFSEWGGSLTKNRRKKKKNIDHFILHDSPCSVPRPWGFHPSQHYFCPNRFLGEVLSSQIEE